ncbi:hypothetical protein HanIR_Chr01g0026321 [Helianthus annuus]|nr:hypothetical protein HanIR_Chr01g0026321 [Helianthus annuus]
MSVITSCEAYCTSLVGGGTSVGIYSHLHIINLTSTITFDPYQCHPVVYLNDHHVPFRLWGMGWGFGRGLGENAQTTITSGLGLGRDPWGLGFKAGVGRS